jgi:hypothetical protein
MEITTLIRPIAPAIDSHSGTTDAAPSTGDVGWWHESIDQQAFDIGQQLTRESPVLLQDQIALDDTWISIAILLIQKAEHLALVPSLRSLIDAVKIRFSNVQHFVREKIDVGV